MQCEKQFDSGQERHLVVGVWFRAMSTKCSIYLTILSLLAGNLLLFDVSLVLTIVQTVKSISLWLSKTCCALQ